MIKTLHDAEVYLSKLYDKVWQTTGNNQTLKRMWPLLEKVGNPQNELRVVHIAGTSGKTSTAYYVAELLKARGCKVGLTVSPHILKLSERLQINTQPISDESFCDYLNRFIELLGDDYDASYFEFLVVFILWAFVQEGVDYAVIETGMGGLFDGTNVCSLENKVCVITDIGLDHQKILGDSLSEIAVQKAGIIHERNHVFCYEQEPTAQQQILQRVQKNNATLHFVKEDLNLHSDLPDYQKRNWLLAHAATNYIAERDQLSVMDAGREVTTQITVPGRMQHITVNDQTFILDGAHNHQKMSAFVASFSNLYPNKKVPVLLAMKSDKDYQKAINLLGPITSKVYCTGFSASQDMPISSVAPELLAKECKSFSLAVEVFPSIESALKAMQLSGESINIVTGSLYILGGVIKQLSTLENKVQAK